MFVQKRETLDFCAMSFGLTQSETLELEHILGCV